MASNRWHGFIFISHKYIARHIIIFHITNVVTIDSSTIVPADCCEYDVVWMHQRHTGKSVSTQQMGNCFLWWKTIQWMGGMARSTCRIDCRHVWSIFNWLFFHFFIGTTVVIVCDETCNNIRITGTQNFHLKRETGILRMLGLIQVINASHIQFDSFASNEDPLRDVPNRPKHDANAGGDSDGTDRI